MELDHVFILCEVAAPEADALRNVGLLEGSANTHPGQGTACRRFFFDTSYLELLWVENPDEAQSALVRPTGLWDRWTRRLAGGSPFGIVLRPPAVANGSLEAPFATESYRPSYLNGASLGVASGMPAEEPAVFWLPFQRNRARVALEPTSSQIGRRLTRVHIGLPSFPITSAVSRIVSAAGVLTFDRADDHVLELSLDDAPTGRVRDLRPRLPLRLRW